MCNIRYAQVIYRLNTNVCVVFPERAPNQLALFGVKKIIVFPEKGTFPKIGDLDYSKCQ